MRYGKEVIEVVKSSFTPNHVSQRLQVFVAVFSSSVIEITAAFTEFPPLVHFFRYFAVLCGEGSIYTR